MFGFTKKTAVFPSSLSFRHLPSSCLVAVLSCLVFTCLVAVLSCLVLSCLVLSLSCLVFVVSCLCRVLSLSLSCLGVLSCSDHFSTFEHLKACNPLNTSFPGYQRCNASHPPQRYMRWWSVRVKCVFLWLFFRHGHLISSHFIYSCVCLTLLNVSPLTLFQISSGIDHVMMPLKTSCWFLEKYCPIHDS